MMDKDLHFLQKKLCLICRSQSIVVFEELSNNSCWNIPHEYGSKVSQVLSESGRTL
jgi:hypothetical protein